MAPIDNSANSNNGEPGKEQHACTMINSRITKTYGDREYVHTVMLRHGGTVIGFAMASNRWIYYSVLDMSQANRGEIDSEYWHENPVPLRFASELAEVGFAVAGSVRMPTVKLGGGIESDNPLALDLEEIDPFLSSTARLSAAAPFQVLSDGKHVFVFRQSIPQDHPDAVFLCQSGDGSGDPARTDYLLANGRKVALVDRSLLCDRFVLVGNELKPSMEVRYRRSRNKTLPNGPKDSLGTEDMDSKTFFEPTQKLSFIKNLADGRFTLLLLPTQVNDIKRWQIFNHNPRTDRIDSWSVEQAEDGLFDLLGSQLYTSPDPQYRDSVLERTPGEDPFTHKELVPVQRESDYAETALQFNGQNQYVSIESDPSRLGFPGKQYTIAAWIKPSRLGRPQGLLTKLDQGRGGSFSFGLNSEGRLRQLHGGSAGELLSTQVVTAGVYQHVAVTYDGASVRFYLNGEPCGSTLCAYQSEATLAVLLGAGRTQGVISDYFDGIIDEVSVWERARLPDEIRRDKGFRLLGCEPGLLAYYRFDEGAGSTLYDQTDQALHGKLVNQPAWVTSDALIGDQPAISRDSFRVSGRTLASGLGSVLYFQQEDASSGYDGEKKPMKRQGRVMLSFAVSGPDPNGGKSDRNYLAMIDFAVGRDGRLAQIPDEVALPAVIPPAAEGSLDEISAAERVYIIAERSLNDLLAQSRSGVPTPTQRAKLDAASRDYEDKGARLAQLTRGRLGDEFTLPVPTLCIDRCGLSISGALLGFAWSNHTPLLTDSAMGQVCMYFRGQDRGQFYAAYYCPDVQRQAMYLGSDDHGLLLVATSAGLDLSAATITVTDGPSADTCTLSIEALGTKETFNRLPRSLQRIADIVAGRATAAAQPDPALRYDYALATSNQPGVRLRRGSRLFQVLPTLDETQLGNGQARRIASAALPHWHGDSPGRALSFDGVSTLLMSGTSDTATLRPAGDLTLEAWVKPDQVSGKSTVLWCSNPQPPIEPYPMTAFMFDTRGALITTVGLNLNVPDFTIEFWIRRRAIAGTPELVLLQQGGFTIALAESVLQFDSAQNWNIRDPQTITDLNWHHFAFVQLGATAEMLLYRDGVLVQRKAGISLYGRSGNVCLGGNQGYSSWWANVELEEIRFWGSARTVQQIQSYSRRRALGTETNLFACFTCEGTNDRTGRSRLSPIGSFGIARSPLPARQAPDLAYTLALASTMTQTALALDGKTSVYCGRGVELRNSDFTIEFWIRRTQSPRKEIVLSHGYDTANGAGKDSVPALMVTVEGQYVSVETPSGKFDSLLSPDTSWHHVALIYSISQGAFVSCVDGGAMMRRLSSGLTYGGQGELYLGTSPKFPDPSRNATCELDEVRIWKGMRSEQELQGYRRRRLLSEEANLLAYYAFAQGEAKDLSERGNHGTLNGTPRFVDSPIDRGYQVVAGGAGQLVQSRDSFSIEDWHHLAFAFQQSWGLRLEQAAYLEVAHADSLNINDDLTIEANLLLQRLGTLQPIIGKGRLADGKGQSVPYAFYVQPDGTPTLSFETASGAKRTFAASSKLTAGVFYRVAVTRKSGTTRDEKKKVLRIDNKDVEVIENVLIKKWDEIRFFINGTDVGGSRYEDEHPLGHRGPLWIGRIAEGTTTKTFAGDLAELRLWKVARDPVQLGKPITTSDSGLVARWRFPENKGNITADDSATYPARLRSGPKWIKTPDPQGSPAWLFVDGQSVAIDRLAPDHPHWTGIQGSPGFAIGGMPMGQPDNPTPVELLSGELEEVRIWRTVRTEEQILDNLFSRLKGEAQDLIAYYPFDDASTRSDATEVRDNSLRGNHLRSFDTANRRRVVLSTAPISNDTAEVRSALSGIKTRFQESIATTPAVAEYGDAQRTPGGGLRGTMKRCYGYIQDRVWHLITGYKIGSLVTEWVGQAQFAPQIIGYVEGAPPVPSENITEGDIDVATDDTSAHSSVKFVQANEVATSVGSSYETSMDGALGVRLGNSVDPDALLIVAPFGIGTAKPIVKGGIKVGVELKTEMSGGWSSEHEVKSSVAASRDLEVKLGGHWEDPKNVRVPSMGRRFIPANTGFALVQSETADVYAMRLEHNNALVGYRMMPNPDIPKDWNLIPFPINPRYTKQGTLDGSNGFNEQGKVLDPDYPMARDYGEYSYFKPREAYSLKRAIVAEQQREQAYYANFSASDLTPKAMADVQDRAGKMMESIVGDLPEATSDNQAAQDAVRSFAKRNLCNTYVWSAKGGFFAETTETTDTVSESTTGKYAYSFHASAKLDTDISFLGVGIDIGFDASFGGGQTLTRTKKREATRTFSLEVNCAPSGNLQKYRLDNGDPIFDSKGNPMPCPGRVDAYRFMTFYLDTDRKNFEDFYGKVVDPMWIEQSSEPNAAALRQARQSGKQPPCWRVLHRVTFVSRLLPEVPPPQAPPIEQAMRASNVASNYALIQQLEPYLKEHLQSPAALADATRRALRTYLPQLVPYADQVIRWLTLYYGRVG